MDTRIIVPVTWENPLRSSLLEALKKLGYTWSAGDSLDCDQQKLHNMTYIAIYLNPLIVKYSSHSSIIEKYVSKCGYNYVVVDPTVDRVMSSIKFMREFLEEIEGDEDTLADFLQRHHFFKDKIKLLS